MKHKAQQFDFAWGAEDFQLTQQTTRDGDRIAQEQQQRQSDLATAAGQQPPLVREGWTRTPGPGGSTCGASWRHHTGAMVKHCGHPTALFPYYGYKANGTAICVQNDGKEFGRYASLKEIMEDALA